MPNPPVTVQRALRFFVLVAIVLGIAAVWHWRGFFDEAHIAAAIAGHPAAPLLFLALQTGASLVFVPRTLLAVAAGLLFGLFWGIVWAALGSTAGAMAGFLVARYINSGLVDIDRARRLRPLLDRAASGGWRAVALLRLVPVLPHSLTNYALGLTRVRIGAYALGSLLGQLPMTVAGVAAGAAGARVVRGGTGWLAPTALGVAALGLTLLLPVLARHRANRLAPLRGALTRRTR
jgi:uncharacterized membrane protein YdjX (TVP38/TMEM64 family)